MLYPLDAISVGCYIHQFIAGMLDLPEGFEQHDDQVVLMVDEDEVVVVMPQAAVTRRLALSAKGKKAKMAKKMARKAGRGGRYDAHGFENSDDDSESSRGGTEGGTVGGTEGGPTASLDAFGFADRAADDDDDDDDGDGGSEGDVEAINSRWYDMHCTASLRRRIKPLQRMLLSNRLGGGPFGGRIKRGAKGLKGMNGARGGRKALFEPTKEQLAASVKIGRCGHSLAH
jgi:hypothetical protein